MIKNLIFDFGDIFINLDKTAPLLTMQKWGLEQISPKHTSLFNAYETGAMGTDEFLLEMNGIFPQVTLSQIKAAWNSMILDFPEYRLEFMETLATEGKYRLFLLSNTNALHIEKVVENMGMERFARFKGCFENCYLSHEINLRKPDSAIYNFVLETNGLKASETFFVDDTKENTEASLALGIKSWNLLVGDQDITALKTYL